MATTPNPFDHFAVQNTIARYCIALDTKDLDLLSRVFTTDVDAIYPFNPNLKGLKAVQDAIRGRLGRITTQHALTTQTITIHADGRSASATTYFTGAHFGREKYRGQVLTAYGKYVDELVCVGTEGQGEVEQGKEETRGASGLWRIGRREVVFMARIGDEEVMSER